MVSLEKKTDAGSSLQTAPETVSGIRDKESRDALRKAAGRLAARFLAFAAASALIWTFVGEIAVIHTSSMYPHIKDGALVATWKRGGLRRNDAVLYEVFGRRTAGRVIGVPGDTVEITDSGLLTVNGSAPYENVFYQTFPAEDSRVEYPLKLRPGEYFLLNDMRETATDSRVFGPVPREQIRGRAVFMLQYRGF